MSESITAPAVDATPAPVSASDAPATDTAVSAPAVTEAPVVPEAPAPVAAPETVETPAPDATVTDTVTDPVASDTAPAQTYADLTLPEGFVAVPEVMAKAAEVFGKYSLSPESAQELMTLHAEQVQAAVSEFTLKATDFWNAKGQDWTREARDDPSFGGNRFETSVSIARGAMNMGLSQAEQDRLATDLTDTKIANHPILFRQFARLGTQIQQVLTATGTDNWADAMKKLKEPAAPRPGNPANGPGGGSRPADRRYGRTG